MAGASVTKTAELFDVSNDSMCERKNLTEAKLWKKAKAVW